MLWWSWSSITLMIWIIYWSNNGKIQSTIGFTFRDSPMSLLLLLLPVALAGLPPHHQQLVERFGAENVNFDKNVSADRHHFKHIISILLFQTTHFYLIISNNSFVSLLPLTCNFEVSLFFIFSNIFILYVLFFISNIYIFVFPFPFFYFFILP